MLQERLNIKSPALVYIISDVRDDDSVGGQTPQLDSHSAHYFQAWCMYAKNQTRACRTHSTLQTACSLAEPAMTSRILSYGCESALRPSLSPLCSLSNPARTTLMTSAVKTQGANASPPPLRPVLRQIPGGQLWRGGDRRSQVWGGVPDARFEGS